uniref:SLAIN motif-containing protein 2-like n=2 Tax=Hirondellea gigas TaxID=1518452 RepID=A0A6A7G2X5_9CRUS
MATSGSSDNEASSDSLQSVTVEECCNTSDEETWLFASPRPDSHSTEWLRKDMDDPSLLIVRRSLLHKLDEIANTPQQTPNGTPRHTPYDTPKHTPNDTPRQTPDLSMTSSPNTSGLVTPDSPPYKGEIDSRTFVRPRKKKILQVNDSPEDRESKYEDRYSHSYENNKDRYERSPSRHENGDVGYDNPRYDNDAMHYDSHNSHNNAIRNQMQQKSLVNASGNNHVGSVLASSSGSLGSEDDEHLSSASESSYCKIADVEDVNTIARLQEESLKLPDLRSRAHEENIRLVTARSKISRLPAPRGRVSAGSSQEDLLGPPPLYRTNNSHASPRRAGDNWGGLSPPISPYTSNNSLNATSGGSNGIRLPPSNPAAAGYGNYGSPSGSRGGSPAREIPSVGGRRSTSRLLPPQIRGVVRSDRGRVSAGIPRPSAAAGSSPLHRQNPASLQQQRHSPAPTSRTPVRSVPSSVEADNPRSVGLRAPRVIPTAAAPAPTLVHKQQQQDWREGCY